MWPGRVSNPGPLTYESGALPTARLYSFTRRLLLKEKNAPRRAIFFFSELTPFEKGGGGEGGQYN